MCLSANFTGVVMTDVHTYVHSAAGAKSLVFEMSSHRFSGLGMLGLQCFCTALYFAMLFYLVLILLVPCAHLRGGRHHQCMLSDLIMFRCLFSC